MLGVGSAQNRNLGSAFGDFTIGTFCPNDPPYCWAIGVGTGVFGLNVSFFHGLSSSPALGGIVDARRTGKPPPALPPELWELILSILGNFSIKKFRLVHPQWASIGARYLFETVYLNVHQHSVVGLMSGFGDPVKLPGLYGSVKSLQGRRLSARS